MTLTVPRTIAVLLAALMVASLATPVAAQEQPWDDELYERMVEMREPYNEQAASLDLGVADGMIANERITFEVTRGGETAHFWLETDGEKRITDMGRGEHENPTLVAKTDAATIRSVATSETPSAAMASAVESGDITFTGQSAGKWTATTVFNIALSVKSFLGL
ncbi:hypothetical protein [Salinigranum rubrum]|nr:hypothetical protein [Salinigranum rubrum]